MIDKQASFLGDAKAVIDNAWQTIHPTAASLAFCVCLFCAWKTYQRKVSGRWKPFDTLEFLVLPAPVLGLGALAMWAAGSLLPDISDPATPIILIFFAVAVLGLFALVLLVVGLYFGNALYLSGQVLAASLVMLPLAYWMGYLAAVLVLKKAGVGRADP